MASIDSSRIVSGYRVSGQSLDEGLSFHENLDDALSAADELIHPPIGEGFQFATIVPAIKVLP